MPLREAPHSLAAAGNRMHGSASGEPLKGPRITAADSPAGRQVSRDGRRLEYRAGSTHLRAFRQTLNLRRGGLGKALERSRPRQGRFHAPTRAVHSPETGRTGRQAASARSGRNAGCASRAWCERSDSRQHRYSAGARFHFRIGIQLRALPGGDRRILAGAPVEDTTRAPPRCRWRCAWGRLAAAVTFLVLSRLLVGSAPRPIRRRQSPGLWQCAPLLLSWHPHALDSPHASCRPLLQFHAHRIGAPKLGLDVDGARTWDDLDQALGQWANTLAEERRNC